jgi:asparagine synthase (glutamine-hydrolysing)
MCGISGVISLNNSKPNYETLFAMSTELSKRGPDGEGYLISNDQAYAQKLKALNPQSKITSLSHSQFVGFGHKRLAITDLSDAALQPMTEFDERYWVVFNGQIYNDVPLRMQLELLGCKFLTHHSDTEVLLNSYKYWGVDCLQKLNGTWSFCIWDSLENTFFISRDRMGVRPMYYAIQNELFYFASEMNALLKNPLLSREISNFAVYDYLTYTSVPAPETIFKSIKKVPASHYAFFKPGDEIKFKKYWSPLENKIDFNGFSEEDIIEIIQEKLVVATKLRIPKDVSLGILLSGGVDSTVNLACLSKCYNQKIEAYGVGFENATLYRNELQYARTSAKYFGAELNELVITEDDFFDFIPKISYYQDEPIADTANIPIYFIAKEAQKQNVKVLLGGEGSDEIFIGYQHWRLIYEFEKFFRNSPSLAGGFEYLHRQSVFKNKRAHYQNWSYKIKNNWPVFWGGTELRTERDKQAILTKDFLSSIGSYNSFTPIQNLYQHFLSNNKYDSLKWMTLNDLQNRLPDQLLARLDRMSMAASIEGRHPFLDIELIEFVFNVPSRLKVKQKTEKYLLKKAFKNIVPKEIINRPKDSFTVPLKKLFENDKRKKAYTDPILSLNKDCNIFTEKYIKDIFKGDNITEFWNVLNLSLWYQTHK